MSELNEFGGTMSFRASFVDESAMRLSHPSSMLIQLADENEWLEEKVGGFKEVIVRYHGKEHRFTPDEVLRALYVARDEPIIRCKDCEHYELEGMYEGCCLLHLERMNGYDPLSDSSYDNDIGMYEMPSDGFCSSAERRDACETG